MQYTLLGHVGVKVGVLHLGTEINIFTVPQKFRLRGGASRAGLLAEPGQVEVVDDVGVFPGGVVEDYQAVDGVKLPLTIRWSMPGRVWGRRIAEVKHNVAIGRFFPALPTYARVSVGTMPEMTKAVPVFRSVLATQVSTQH